MCSFTDEERRGGGGGNPKAGLGAVVISQVPALCQTGEFQGAGGGDVVLGWAGAVSFLYFYFFEREGAKASERAGYLGRGAEEESES